MTFSAAPIFVLAAAAVAWEWKLYRRGSRTDRWAVFLFYAASCALWWWITRDARIPRPADWIDSIW
ncbi:hypothetical protein [Paenibacillus sp.]|uniref:hypothetical protein n=1 Tax=Paenibacillus sp. TaxID=58172 RepID=UPI002D290E7E|nr:hypothetical protein [Paenibacillus sp.]HZG87737.1 hypothetical protein [Paenibacillus sp.]